MIHRTGIDFTKAPELFRSLQNKELGELVAFSSRLAKSYRFPFVLLLTCDRAEIIAEEKAEPEPLERALGLRTPEVKQYRYSIPSGTEDILVFSTGVTSPLFGEDTIQGQLAIALEASRLAGTSSPYLRKLLSSAVAFAKRMHTEMKLRVFDRTIVDEVARRLEGYGDILIIGSGESARLIAEKLKDEHQVTMTLRDTDKLFLLPPGVMAISYDERFERVKDFNAVVSATSGLYHSFESEDLGLLDGKLLFDLSSPPDLPPEAHGITVDELKVELPERERVIAKVRLEAKAEAEKLVLWKENAESFSALNSQAERIAAEALRRLNGPVARLRLSSSDELAFRNSLSDSIRKAVIAENLKKGT